MRLLLICLASFSFFPLLKSEPLQLSVHAESAILMNAETGAILYAKNPHALNYPASITKIATVLYTLRQKRDHLDVPIAADQEIIGWVSEEAIRRSNYTLPSYLLIPGCSHVGIKKGEILTLRDLLYGIMLASGDDASNVVAQYTSGTIPKFMEEVNQFIRTIGCQNTTFCNPHGLHHPRHQTTAYDMALLTREALNDPLFCEIASAVRYTRPKTNKQEASTWIQSNKLLRQGLYYYPKAIGVKTGYLSIANNTFVSAARDGDRTLIAVQLKVPERKDIFLDAVKMFESAFNQPKVSRTLLKKGAQKFILELPEAEKPIHTFIENDIKIEYYPAEEPEIKSYLSWNKLKLPIEKDQVVGEITLKFSDGTASQAVPLFAVESVQKNWPAWFKEHLLNSSLLFKGIGLLLVLSFLIGMGLQLRRRL